MALVFERKAIATDEFVAGSVVVAEEVIVAKAHESVGEALQVLGSAVCKRLLCDSWAKGNHAVVRGDLEAEVRATQGLAHVLLAVEASVGCSVRANIGCLLALCRWSGLLIITHFTG